MSRQLGAVSRRRQLLEGTVQFLLEQGLIGLSLRPLAKALGTSDRMLLYYFDSRDELLEAALAEIGLRLQEAFEAQLPHGGATPLEAVEAAIRGMRDPAVRSQLQVWVEVVVLAARGDRACERIVAAVTSGWSEWLQAQLRLPQPEARRAAAAVMATVDGLVLLSLAGRDDLVDDAAGSILVGPHSG